MRQVNRNVRAPVARDWANRMNYKKWVEIKPVGYLGLVLGMGGITFPIIFSIDDSITLFIGAIVSFFGWYLALYKGRKEHGT